MEKLNVYVLGVEDVIIKNEFVDLEKYNGKKVTIIYLGQKYLQ